MKNILFIIIIFIQLSSLTASTHQVTPINNEKIPGVFMGATFDGSPILEEDGFFRGHGINDNGSVYGVVNTELGKAIYISDPNKGSYLISSSPNNYISTYYKKIFYSNKDQLLGQASPGNGTYSIFIWDTLEGIKEINIFNHSFVIARDFNEAGQIIGESAEKRLYPKKTRPFLWDKGATIDMGPGSQFANQIQEQGFVPVEIKLESINSKGEIAGFFTYGKYNKVKKEYVPVGKKAFFWNGEVHIISLPLELVIEQSNILNSHDGRSKILLNTNGTVLVSVFNDITYQHLTILWGLGSELRILHDFEAYAMNDKDAVIGTLYDTEEDTPTFVLWDKDSYTTISELLGSEDLSNIALPFSDNYEVEKIKTIYDINNNGQIVALGYVWGEWLPCIIEPKLIDCP